MLDPSLIHFQKKRKRNVFFMINSHVLDAEAKVLLDIISENGGEVIEAVVDELREELVRSRAGGGGGGGGAGATTVVVGACNASGQT